MTKPPLTLYLAAPRGFCAGVDRAINIVEMALEKWGAPVFVRHEIVHNKFVVDSLRDQGAVFVEELDECPDGRPVIFFYGFLLLRVEIFVYKFHPVSFKV